MKLKLNEWQRLLKESFSIHWWPADSTYGVEELVDKEFGLLFMSIFRERIDENLVELIKEIDNCLDREELELSRQEMLVYGESTTTGPHTSQYDETLGKSPDWIWQLR